MADHGTTMQLATLCRMIDRITIRSHNEQKKKRKLRIPFLLFLLFIFFYFSFSFFYLVSFSFLFSSFPFLFFFCFCFHHLYRRCKWKIRYPYVRFSLSSIREREREREFVVYNTINSILLIPDRKLLNRTVVLRFALLMNWSKIITRGKVNTFGNIITKMKRVCLELMKNYIRIYLFTR